MELLLIFWITCKNVNGKSNIQLRSNWGQHRTNLLLIPTYDNNWAKGNIRQDILYTEYKQLKHFNRANIQYKPIKNTAKIIARKVQLHEEGIT